MIQVADEVLNVEKLNMSKVKCHVKRFGTQNAVFCVIFAFDSALDCDVQMTITSESRRVQGQYKVKKLSEFCGDPRQRLHIV